MNTAEAVFERAQLLQQSGTPYALVSVIRALAPASARAGDKAVVTADGQMHGWIGGGCAQPAVLRTVRQVLAEGHARLMRISPADEGSEKTLGDVLEFGMTCHSGGTLELFVDPILPRARLVVIGSSPVARSLVTLAPHVGFAVTAVAPGSDVDALPGAQRVLVDDDPATVRPHVGAGAWVVVATQGRRDVQGLRLALALEARQVSFVASAKKAQVLKASLVAAGADGAAVDAIVAPAGYPMAATTPEEIALSVLAAIVSARRATTVEALLAHDAPALAVIAKAAPAAATPARGSCCGG
ncbi:MAG TPA: XdhC family protein [Burkholderiaceae bacterium]|jgi:xanthine dehydrogenase accessory factor|nr:XdhC family protein [Burkholderiaceae bacterium]